MSQNTTIRVDPQELRDTATHFHHSSAEIERITTDLRHAVAGLDTGCWPAGEAARLSAQFAEAEAEGRRLAQRRTEMGDTLMRAADAFERADTVAVQQLMGLPSGWMVPSPVVTGGGKALNSTVLDTRLPAPVSPLTAMNWTGLAMVPTIDWYSVITVVLAVFALLGVAAGFIGLVVSIVLLAMTANPLFLITLFLAILLVIISALLLGELLLVMTADQVRLALKLAALVLTFPAAVVAALIAFKVITGVGVILGIILFFCFIIKVFYLLWDMLFPFLFPDWDSTTIPTPISSNRHTLNPSLLPILTSAPAL